MGRQHGRAFDNPEACPTGTITVDGREPAIVPEKCVGWVDFQWGNSYAADGWFSAGQRCAYCDYDDEPVAQVYAVLHLHADVPE